MQARHEGGLGGRQHAENNGFQLPKIEIAFYPGAFAGGIREDKRWKACYSEAAGQAKIDKELVARLAVEVCQHLLPVQPGLFGGRCELLQTRNIFPVQKQHLPEPPQERDRFRLVLSLRCLECNGRREGRSKWVIPPYH